MTSRKEQLNTLANNFYEFLSNFDPMQDPVIEDALRDAVNALDQLCLVTYAEVSQSPSDA